MMHIAYPQKILMYSTWQSNNIKHQKTMFAIDYIQYFWTKLQILLTLKNVKHSLSLEKMSSSSKVNSNISGFSTKCICFGPKFNCLQRIIKVVEYTGIPVYSVSVKLIC